METIFEIIVEIIVEFISEFFSEKKVPKYIRCPILAIILLFICVIGAFFFESI